MTREEQIISASQLYAKAQQKPFMDGAMWADKHPTEEVQRLKRISESAPDAYEQGYNDAIEKACKLLKKAYRLTDTTIEIIRKGIKAMEEQK